MSQPRTDRELMQQALEALEAAEVTGNCFYGVTELLRTRLAQPEQHSEQWWRHEVSNAYANGYEKGRASVKQPEQEPVAQVDYNERGNICYICWLSGKQVPDKTLLYTAPPQREWQGLTDEEIKKEQHHIDWTSGHTYAKFARAIEAKLKEKNGG